MSNEKDLKKGMFVVGEVRRVNTNDKGYTDVYLDIDELYPVKMNLGKEGGVPVVGDIIKYQRFGIRAKYWNGETKKYLNASYQIFPVEGEKLS